MIKTTKRSAEKNGSISRASGKGFGFEKSFSFRKLVVLVLISSFMGGGIAGAFWGFIGAAISSRHALSWIEENIFRHETENERGDIVEEEPMVIDVAAEQSAVIEAVEKAAPSVVSIVITKDLGEYYNLTGPDIFPFDDFFEFPFSFRFPTSRRVEIPEGQRKQEVGGGTGFIISEDGLILTNRHVVSDEDAEYSVITSEGERHDAKILAIDPILDIAVIKVETEDLPVLQLGDSDTLKRGQTVIAIGNALSQYSNSVTKGVVSGTGRSITAYGGGRSERLDDVIQTDAAINPGNSGGPLLDLSGEAVGINTAINQSGQLVGFAIPINNVKEIIESVREHGRIIRPLLGIRYTPVTEKISKANDLPVDYGALVLRGENSEDLAVIPGGPADKAGIVENDIILEIEGQKIDQDHDLARVVAKYAPGDQIEIKLLHRGEEKLARTTLEERK